jgi:hypothetical protein
MKISNQRIICAIFLVIITQQFVNLAFSTALTIKPINEEYEPENIGAPIYSYRNMIVEGDAAYLLRNDEIDVMNISNPEKTLKIDTYNLNNPYMMYPSYNTYYFYNLSHGKFSSYVLSQNELGSANGSLFYYEYELQNKTFEVIKSSNASITFDVEYRDSRLFLDNNTLHVVMINTNLDDYYNLTLSSYDVTNRSNPILISNSILHEEIDFTIWGNPYYYVFKYQDIYFYNNHLFLTRAFRTYNYTDYFSSAECVFAYGFMKIWDISNTSDPLLINHFELEEWSYSFIRIFNNLLFYSMAEYGFLLYDCSNLSSLKLLTSYQNDDQPIDFVIEDNTLYLVNEYKIEIIDLSNPTNLKRLSKYYPHFQGNGYFGKGIIKNNHLFVKRSSEKSDRCFYIFDCSNLNNIKRLYPDGIYISAERWPPYGLLIIIGAPILLLIIIVTVVVSVIKAKNKKRKAYEEYN